MKPLSKAKRRYLEELGIKGLKQYEWHLARIVDYFFDWDHGGVFVVEGEYTDGNTQAMALHIDSGSKDKATDKYISMPIFRRLFIEEFMKCVGVSRLDDLKHKLVYFLKNPSEGPQGAIRGFAYPPFVKHEYDNRFCIVSDWLNEQQKIVKSMAERWTCE
jgi:hypothetical protein